MIQAAWDARVAASDLEWSPAEGGGDGKGSERATYARRETGHLALLESRRAWREALEVFDEAISLAQNSHQPLLELIVVRERLSFLPAARSSRRAALATARGLDGICAKMTLRPRAEFASLLGEVADDADRAVKQGTGTRSLAKQQGGTFSSSKASSSALPTLGDVWRG